MLDVLIRGGTIVDGTGTNGFCGDVGIVDDRIAFVGTHIDAPARQEIDVAGLVVCPGFIDAHAHDDLALLYDTGLPYKLMQGVTTTVVGNCGHSVAPLPDDERLRMQILEYMEPVLGSWSTEGLPLEFPESLVFFDAIHHARPSINAAALVGHGTLRASVMGFADRAANEGEIREMQALLQRAMASGALGMSLGLMYMPGCYASSDELRALAHTVQACGGIVTAHIRGEGDMLLPSIREMLDVATVTGASVHISHLKAVGKHNWGHVDEAIRLIARARTDGIDVTCDAYPYTAGSTTLLSLLPPSALQGGVGALMDRLKNREAREHIRSALLHQGDDWENVALITGWDRVTIVSCPLHQAYEHRSIQEIAEMHACDAVEAYFRVIEDGHARGTIVVHHMDATDVSSVIAFSQTVVGSDGLPSPEGHPHPRLYGTFPKLIADYVRNMGVLTLEQAVHKATAQTADRFKLDKRGRIRPGDFADIVVFDLDTFTDLATYANPRQFPSGMKYVWVNGELAVKSGIITASRSGTFVKRSELNGNTLSVDRS